MSQKHVYVVKWGERGRGGAPFLVTWSLRKAMKAAVAKLADDFNLGPSYKRCEFFGHSKYLRRIKKMLPASVARNSKFNKEDWFWLRGQKAYHGRRSAILWACDSKHHAAVIFRLVPEVPFVAGRDRMAPKKKRRKAR